MVGEVGGNAVSNVLTSGIAVNLNLTVFDVSISIPTVFGETKSFQCDFAVSCLALIIALSVEVSLYRVKEVYTSLRCPPNLYFLSEGS